MAASYRFARESRNSVTGELRNEQLQERDGMEIFDIIGEQFFKPLAGQFKTLYFDCLTIIYESYRLELSYGIDREILVAKLTDYFDNLDVSDIQFEDEQETLSDSHTKAVTCLRRLKDYGWIECEFGNDQAAKIIMPNHAVTVIQTLLNIAGQNEMEYQSELSAIYSLLTNEELLGRPYPQIIKPVYERTLALFTGLKKLNTSIKKYIEDLTNGKQAEDILHDFFTYHEEIGSKAYHRIKTSDNVSRFRNTIIRRLQEFLSDQTLFDRAAAGYQNIENENDMETASEKVHGMIADVIDHFRSYDEIVAEIDRKHTKYIRNAVERAKFLLLNTNNMEGKVSAVLQYLAEKFNEEERNNLTEEVSDDICVLFNMFPQGFLSQESLKSEPISKRITDVEDIFTPELMSTEERELRRRAVYEKNKNRFSKKNIEAYVAEIIKDKNSIYARELPMETRRDTIRTIFIAFYGHDAKSSYRIVQKTDMIRVNGFAFRDFEIIRRIK